MTTLSEITVWGLLKTGGPLMIPILFCSFAALGIIIEKILYFRSIKTDTSLLKNNIFELVKQNKIKDAVQLCDANPSPTAKILKAGIIKLGRSRDEVKESMADVSLYEIPKLELRLSALATIAHITPLLGLLGTVTGMASGFFTIQARATALSPVTPADLAGGIGEALLTTVASLIVAIPVYLAYNYFVSRINYIVLEMERAATELLNYVSQAPEFNP